MKINYPILCYLNGALFVDTGIAMKAMGGRFTPEGTFVSKEVSQNEVSGWIIECDGSFIELIPISKRRLWARPVSFLWRFTLSEFKVLPKRRISIEELKSKVRTIRDTIKNDPIASDLWRHLGKYDPNDIVTEKVLGEWPI